MLKEIINEVEIAIDTAYEKMSKQDYLSYVLFIGRADVVPYIDQINGTKCVIDYQLDRYYDKNRDGFYIRYLRRNYGRDGFRYEGDDGIDDLNIEMMIYDHLWESSYFLKSLVRIASILSGKEYIWQPEIPDRGKWEFIHKQIINPLKECGSSLGFVVEKAYSSDIRDSFAHSLYTINKENRTITLRPKRGITTISFDDFQDKFLYSVVLMNKMQNALERNHDNACLENAFITKPFLTPDGVKVQIKAECIQKGTMSFPRYRMIPVTDD